VGVALLLLSPQIPLIFMGEEQGIRDPFLYFTDYQGDLAEAVKNGRRKEFGKFPEFATPEAQRQIPDPNKRETFERSRPNFTPQDGWARDWQDFYSRLLTLRREVIVPRLEGAMAESAKAPNPQAVIARWRLGDGSRLTLAANFGTEALAHALPQGRLLFA